MDGVQATKITQEEVPEANIVLITQNGPGVVRREATEVGCSVIVPKSDLSREVKRNSGFQKSFETLESARAIQQALFLPVLANNRPPAGILKHPWEG